MIIMELLNLFDEETKNEILSAAASEMRALSNAKSYIKLQMNVATESEDFAKYDELKEIINIINSKIDVIKSEYGISEEHMTKGFNWDEDITYAKPEGIKIKDDFIEAKKWISLLSETILYLHKKDKDKLNKYVENNKDRYIKFDSKELTRAIECGMTGIYVESKTKSNEIKNSIRKLLKEYNINENKCEIIFRKNDEQTKKKKTKTSCKNFSLESRVCTNGWCDHYQKRCPGISGCEYYKEKEA